MLSWLLTLSIGHGKISGDARQSSLFYAAVLKMSGLKTNQELKALVASLRDGKPVEPITSKPTPLVKSLNALTGVAHAADVVATDLGPLCRVMLCRCGLTSSPSLCDKKGVVKDLGAVKSQFFFRADFTFKSRAPNAQSLIRL